MREEKRVDSIKSQKASIKPKVSTPRTNHQVGSQKTAARSWKVVPRHALHQPPNGDSHRTPKPAFSLHLGANLEPNPECPEEREMERSPATRSPAPAHLPARPAPPRPAASAPPAVAPSRAGGARAAATPAPPSPARPPTAASRITPGPEGQSTRAAAELRSLLGSRSPLAACSSAPARSPPHRGVEDQRSPRAEPRRLAPPRWPAAPPPKPTPCSSRLRPGSSPINS